MTFAENLVALLGLATIAGGIVWLLCLFQHVIDQLADGQVAGPDGFRDYATEHAGLFVCTAAPWCAGLAVVDGRCRHHADQERGA